MKNLRLFGALAMLSAILITGIFSAGCSAIAGAGVQTTYHGYTVRLAFNTIDSADVVDVNVTDSLGYGGRITLPLRIITGIIHKQAQERRDSIAAADTTH